MTKKRIFKISRILLLVIGVLIICAVINFFPTFNLKTSGMSRLDGKWVNVYYEKENEAAEDVFNFIEENAKTVIEKLGFNEKQDVNIYIYDYQSTMQKKKYGFIAPLLNLDWYIGDNIGTNVILTSPANPGKYHDYKTIREASLHELTHAYISEINSKIHLWLTEGMALYLSNAEPFYKKYTTTMEIPSYEDTCTRNPIKFSDCGGYTFSNTYIEYIDKNYGWDKVLEIVRTEDYEKTFGKTQRQIYDEWISFIKNYYQ